MTYASVKCNNVKFYGFFFIQMFMQAQGCKNSPILLPNQTKTV